MLNLKLLLFSVFTASIIPYGYSKSCILGSIFKHETDCRKYYHCTHWGPQEMPCAPGTAFDIDIGLCNHYRPELCKNNEDTKPLPPPPEEPDHSNEDTSEELSEPLFKPTTEVTDEPEENTAEPDDETEKSLEPEQPSDESEQLSDESEEVSEEPEQISVPIKPIAKPEEDEMLTRICSNFPTALLPFPGDCSRYIICYNTDPRVFSCREGSYYDVNIRGCSIFTSCNV